MSNVLFGQSYYLRFDPKLWAAMQPYPPLGTLYAAALLRARGYDVALFDAMLAESEAEWTLALDREQPRFAIIYEDNFNYLSKMCLLRMRQAAFAMIAAAHERGCTVIVCGSDASDHTQEYLAQGADFVLIGEGEATLVELMDRLSGESSQAFQDILGLAFLPGSGYESGTSHKHNGKHTIELLPHANQQGEQPASPAVLRSPKRSDLKQLDQLPFPAWDLIDVERYRKIWLERHGYFSMNMVTTRGCPYHCNWCAKPIWGQRYNVRSPENVVAELQWLKQTYHPDHIWFADDIVGLKPGWIKRFADLVEQNDARVPFKCLSRVDLLVREETIDAFRRAGCKIIWVGAESGSQHILDAMEKGTRVEQIVEAAHKLHQAGIQVGFFLQFGYPGETRADIEKTLQMVRDCRPDDIGMSVSYPLPGTPFFERVKDELGLQQNWQDSNDLAMLYNGPYPTQFYRQLHRVLHHEFRSRRAWEAATRQPGRNILQRLRKIGVSAYHLVRLFPARWRLAVLERARHQGIGTLPHGMTQEAAASPTPQAE